MADMVRQAYEQRKAESIVDLAPLYAEVSHRIGERLPVAVQSLKEHGYPSHKMQQEIEVDGKKRIAWVAALRSPESEVIKVGKDKDRKSPYLVALVIDDDGIAPPTGALWESHEAEGSYRPFKPYDAWIVHVNGVAGFLQELAKPPKREVWDE